MTEEKYWVDINPWPNTQDWFKRLHQASVDIADQNGWHVNTVIDHQVRPYGGKFKDRNTHDSIRFDSEPGYTMFLLKWA